MIYLILLTLWSQHFNVHMIKTHQVNLIVRLLETNTWHFLLIILNRISVMQEMQSHKLSCWHKSLSNLLMLGLVRGFFPPEMQNKYTTWPLCFQTMWVTIFQKDFCMLAGNIQKLLLEITIHMCIFWEWELTINWPASMQILTAGSVQNDNTATMLNMIHRCQ